MLPPGPRTSAQPAVAAEHSLPLLGSALPTLLHLACSSILVRKERPPGYIDDDKNAGHGKGENRWNTLNKRDYDVCRNCIAGSSSKEITVFNLNRKTEAFIDISNLALGVFLF